MLYQFHVYIKVIQASVQFSHSVCPTFCYPMDCIQMPLALPLSVLCFVETGNSLGTRAPCIPFLPGLGSPE